MRDMTRGDVIGRSQHAQTKRIPSLSHNFLNSGSAWEWDLQEGMTGKRLARRRSWADLGERKSVGSKEESHWARERIQPCGQADLWEWVGEIQPHVWWVVGYASSGILVRWKIAAHWIPRMDQIPRNGCRAMQGSEAGEKDSEWQRNARVVDPGSREDKWEGRWRGIEEGKLGCELVELRQDYPKGITEARGRDYCFVGTISARLTGMGGLGDWRCVLVRR